MATIDHKETEREVMWRHDLDRMQRDSQNRPQEERMARIEAMGP